MNQEEVIQKDDVFRVLGHVFDPDYRDKSIVDLGLVNEEDINITQRGLEIQYRVTAPLCPFSSAIGVMIQYALEKIQSTRESKNEKRAHANSSCKSNTGKRRQMQRPAPKTRSLRDS